MRLKPTYLLTALVCAATGLTACTNETPVNQKVTILPIVGIAETTPIQVAETGTGSVAATFTVTLSEPQTYDIPGQYITVSGTATAQKDFEAKTPQYAGKFAFPAGSTATTISIPVYDDHIHETEESFQVQLTFAFLASVDPAHSTGTVTIADNDPLPNLRLDPTVSIPTLIPENGGGITLSFQVLNPADSSKVESGVPIVVQLLISGDASQDVVDPGSITIPAGVDTFDYHLALIDNALADAVAKRTLQVDFGNVDNAVLTSNTGISLNVQDDDPSGTLNDTGVAQCYNGTTALSTCPTSGTPFADQDAQFGTTGFNVTADPTGICEIDNITGLMWAPLSSGTYTWYNVHDNINGGEPGARRDAATYSNCPISDVLSTCDTEALVAAVNASNLCGYNDWRLPKLEELLSRVTYTVAPTTGTQSDYYWTGTPSADYSDSAWQVDFATGEFLVKSKSASESAARVRLVRPNRP